jgi:hypothetical protein
LINYVFTVRLLAFALAVGVIQLLLAFSPLRAMPWALLAEAFFMSALVLHKRSISIACLNASTEPPLRVFLKSFFVYVVPAGILWGLFVVGVFQNYLPRIGLTLRPLWGTLSGTIGMLAQCAGLVGDELSQLGRSP